MTLAKPSFQAHFDKSKKLNNEFVFSRNSTASYVDADGIIRYAAVDEPRFDHDPTTGEPLGLLLEPEVINYFRLSEQVDGASWGKTAILAFGSGSVANATTAPDGTTTADLVVPDTTTTSHFVQNTLNNTVTFVDGDYWTLSGFFKPAGYNFLRIICYWAFGTQGIRLDLSTGTWLADEGIGNSGYTIQAYPNGWWRVSVTMQVVNATTYPSTATMRFVIAEANSTSTWAGDGTSGMYIWGAQFEKNNFLTSYLPTPTNVYTYTREADELSMPNIGEWYNPTEGTFIGDVQSMHPADTEGVQVHLLSVGNTNPGYVLYRNDGFPGYYSWDGDSSVGGVSPPTYNSMFRYGLTYGDGVRDMSINGVPAATGKLNGSNLSSLSSVQTFGNMNDGLRFELGNKQGQRIKSLVYIPKRVSRQELIKLTGEYQDILVPSLNLNFAGSNILDSRVTFSRASSIGTAFGPDGYLREFPGSEPRFGHDPVTKEPLGLLIERAKSNYARHSEKIYGVDAVSTSEYTWISGGGNNSALVRASLTSEVAPDGSLNAIKIITGADGSNKYHSWGIDCSLDDRSVAHTFSVFVKAGEYTQAVLKIINGSMATSGTWVGNAVFDLATGQVGATSGTYFSSAGMIPAGNGWWRCWVTVTATAANAGPGGCAIAVDPAASNTNFITGDGKSGLYVWGYNMQDASWLTSYIPADTTFTSRASIARYWGSDGLLTDAAIDEKRMSYNPTNLSVPPKPLYEPERTNIQLNSQVFGSWATQTGLTLTTNDEYAPNGLLQAEKIIESAVFNNHYIANPVSTNYVPGQVYTASVFIKPITLTRHYVLGIQGSAWADGLTRSASFSSQTSTISGTYNGATANVQYVGGGWYRFSISYVPDTAAAAETRISIATSAASGPTAYTGNGVAGAYIWGAQVEAGHGASSYIHTTSAAVTRSADVTSPANKYTRWSEFASITTPWANIYNSHEGTFYAKFMGPPIQATTGAASTGFIVSANDGTNNNRISIAHDKPNVGTFIGCRVNNSSQGYLSSGLGLVEGQMVTVAGSYKTNEMRICQNGDSGATDTSLSPPDGLTQLNIGHLLGDNPINGYISRIVYIPKAVSLNQLIKMSTC